jgi:hypothetical protein
LQRGLDAALQHEMPQKRIAGDATDHGLFIFR